MRVHDDTGGGNGIDKFALTDTILVITFLIFFLFWRF